MRRRVQLEPGLTGRWTRVACTGHRPQGLPSGCEPWLADELRRIAARLAADRGMQVAISGAAAGADLLWAEAAHDVDILAWPSDFCVQSPLAGGSSTCAPWRSGPDHPTGARRGQRGSASHRFSSSLGRRGP